jgi:N-acetylneuraminic acid mutarotase
MRPTIVPVVALGGWLLSTFTGCGARSDLDGTGPGSTVDAGAPTAPCDQEQMPCSHGVTLFGGFDNPNNKFLGDTWDWDGNTWSLRATTGPSARAGHAMAALHGNVVLFGGGEVTVLASTVRIESEPKGDTWEWDGSSWTQREVAGPSARSGLAMVALNDKIVLFGGGIPGRSLSPNETWEWDGNTWTLRATSGPAARAYHVMAALAGKIILFGGEGANGDLDDFWEWDGTAWTERTVYGAMGYGPNARAEDAAAVLNDAFVLFGGINQAFLPVGETWKWDTSLWSEGTTAGPSARYEAAMATFDSKALLFGGDHFGDPAVGADTWEWDGTLWLRRDVAGPSARSGHALVAR